MRFAGIFIAIFFFIQVRAQHPNRQRKDLDVLEYTFEIHLSDTTNIIRAKTKAKIMLLHDLEYFYLDFKSAGPEKGMHVISVETTDAKPLPYTHKNDYLTIIPPENKHIGDTLQVEISYAGIPADGLFIGKNKYGKKVFFADHWPDRASYWLPVIDHPSDKARVVWKVEAPMQYDVIANGTLIEKHNLGSTYLWVYRTGIPISTKVMTMGAAGFDIKYYNGNTAGQGKIPVSAWIYKDSPGAGIDDYKSALKALRYYSELIAPYPFLKLANVQSKTRYGGMENAGTIFYNENSVTGRKSNELLVAHEVAHQWFGDCVSEKNWRDIWLSEGFATYLTDLYVEHYSGEEAMKKRLISQRKKVIAYAKKSLQPVVYDENDLIKLLNPNSYEKAAWILHMLRVKVGDGMFFNILREFYRTYKLKNASTSDFIDLAEQVSGYNLQAFFSQWLYRNDIPKIRVENSLYGDADLLVMDIIQEQEKPYHFLLPVQIISGEQVIEKQLLVKNKTHRYKINLPPSFEEESVRIVIDPRVELLFEYVNLWK